MFMYGVWLMQFINMAAGNGRDIYHNMMPRLDGIIYLIMFALSLFSLFLLFIQSIYRLELSSICIRCFSLYFISGGMLGLNIVQFDYSV